MQKKIFAWAMSMAMAAMFTCTGCSQSSSLSTDIGSTTAVQTTAAPNQEDSEETAAQAATGETVSTLQTDGVGVTTDEDDLCDSYTDFDAEIALEDDNTKITGKTANVSVSGNRITISAGGTYRLHGTLTNGQVIVTGTEKVKLYLDGVEITNNSGAALVCVNEKRTIVTLAENTDNKLSDSAENTETTMDSYNVSACALFAQDKLTINGKGTLAVDGNSEDGIVCKDDLKLVGGEITVNAVQDGVKGKDCVAMFGAALTVTAGNDGVKSTETEDTAKGFLQLQQGSITVTAGGDCLQAETAVWVIGGDYTLTSNGTATDAETGESNSSKGIKCGGSIDISGGTLEIDAAEDGIHCDGALSMTYGTVTVNSAEDGIQADGDLSVIGGTINVTTTGTVAASSQNDDFQGGGFGGDMQGGGFGGGMQGGGFGGNITATAYLQTAEETADTDNDTEDATSKGIKCGGNLTISGGSCTVTSTDHAIHAAGTAVITGGTLDLSSDNKGISAHGNLEIQNGDITINNCTEGIESKAEMTISGGNIRILNATDDGLNTGGTESDSHAMKIAGGYIYIDASGDGVDSNGTWEMTGGTLLVCGPTSGGDGSLDANGTMTYSGGTLLALSSKGMMEYPESGCLVATNCSASAGDQISIADADGNILVTLTTTKEVSDVIYGIGENSANDYTIVTGGTYSGTLNEDGYGEGGTISGGTQVTANGGSGNGSGGMQGGNPQDGGMQGGFGGGAPGRN